jgi:hypothetical protein
MQIGTVLASNKLFIIAYTFALSWLSFGLNGYTILKQKVELGKINEFIKSLPFYMKFWYIFLSEDKFHKDPSKTLYALASYTYVFWYCVIGVIFLLVCCSSVIAIMLFSIRVSDYPTTINCILNICIFFLGIGRLWTLNSKLVA